jgi:non-heme chloroperoxidase
MSVEENIQLATTSLSTGPMLHYAERGDPNGEAVVFLHGYSDSWCSYSRVLPLLAPSYHAFALTQRGHGDSDKPECCYTPEDFAADVDVFMDAVGIEEATLVGASTGTKETTTSSAGDVGGGMRRPCPRLGSSPSFWSMV